MDSKSNAAMRTDDTLPDTPTALPESKTVPETPSVSLSETASKTEKPGAVPLRIWMRGTGARYLVRIMALVVAVVLWELASDNGFHFYVSFDNIPAPSIVGSALVAELTGQEFYLHILHSLERVAIAYVLAVVLGVVIGIAMGRSRWAEDIILPYIELLRPIPAVAWIPLAILMLPTEQSSIVFITFLGALFPVILNTVDGIEDDREKSAQKGNEHDAGLFRWQHQNRQRNPGHGRDRAQKLDVGQDDVLCPARTPHGDANDDA